MKRKSRAAIAGMRNPPYALSMRVLRPTVRLVTYASLLALCLTLPLSAAAGKKREAQRAWETAMSAADEAAREGRVDHAVTLYRQAMDLATPFGERGLRMARSIDGLADVLYVHGRYEEAEPLYLESLAIWEELFGPDQPRSATTAHNLGAVYLAQKRYAEAEPMFQRAMEVWTHHFGEDSREVALALDARATLLQKQDRWDEAEPLRLRALAIRRSLGLE